ncbi:MAG: hypothetical protein R6V13_11290 [Anaerolineae bacterium]
MHTGILLPVVVLGGMLLGAIPLLIAVEGENVSEQAMEHGERAAACHGRHLVWLCLLPLLVYILLWSSVSASLSWSALVVGGALLAIVAAVILCADKCEGKEDPGSDVF